MAQWPPFPIQLIDDQDLVVWPGRVEVGPLSVVGPTAENQQPVAIDVRSETMRLLVNQLAAMFNEVRAHFLDRDGADPAEVLESGETSEQGPVWMRADLDMGGFKVVDILDSTDPLDLVAFNQLQQVQQDGEDTVEQILDTRIYKIDGSAVGIANLQAGSVLGGVNRVINVALAVAPTDVVRKDTFDTQITDLRAALVLLSGGSLMTGNLNLDGPTPPDPGFFPVNVADPTVDGDLANKRYLDEQVALVGAEDVPTGTVLPYAGPESSVPTNFLVCDGREVSRFVYQNLFNIIGIAYGPPSSGSVFKLPDLRGRVVVGKDNMGFQPAGVITQAWASVLGGTGGIEAHPLTVSQLPAHTHDYDDHLFAEDTVAGTDPGGDDGADADNVHSEEVRVSESTGSGLPHNNLQPSMTQLYLIRA